MAQSIAHVAIVVRDYDEAIAYYTGALGFDLVEDTPLGGGKRWVLVRPPGSDGTCLLLARSQPGTGEPHRQPDWRTRFLVFAYR